MPNERAISKFPLSVSKAMVVVMTLVKPAMIEDIAAIGKKAEDLEFLLPLARLAFILRSG